MKKLIKISAVLASLIILLSVFTVTAYAESGILIHGKFNFDFAEEMFNYINDYRELNGLNKLERDFDLVEPAMLRAAECSVLCSHTRPNSKPWNTAFLWEEDVAENFAMGFSNPREATDAYYNSEGHRINMLGDYTRVGVGVFTADNGANYWIHLFTRGEVKKAYMEKGVRDVTVNVAENPEEETVVSYTDGLPTPTENAEAYEQSNAPEIKIVSLSKTVFEYNGRTQTPEVIVKDNNGDTVDSKYYTLTVPKKSSACGVYTVKAEAKYSDKSFSLEYKIIPKTLSVKYLTKTKSSVIIKWSRASGSVSGIKLCYALNKSFTKSKKTLTLNSSKTSKTIKGLKKGKRYYFKVRDYKKTDSETLYSQWSKVKSIKK